MLTAVLVGPAHVYASVTSSCLVSLDEVREKLCKCHQTLMVGISGLQLSGGGEMSSEVSSGLPIIRFALEAKVSRLLYWEASS
jgi:hypothetical protein